MFLRKLKISDAPLMLEWMCDENITRCFRANFSQMTLDDAKNFIASSEKITPQNNINAAVSSDSGEYMGTVSLKHIDFSDKCAEFAIVMRKSAMGRGFAWFGMREIISRAFQDLRLALVYWNVRKNNFRAVRFYDKHNFSEMLCVPEKFSRDYQGVENLKWYYVKSLMTTEKTLPIIDARRETRDARRETRDARRETRDHHIMSLQEFL